MPITRDLPALTDGHWLRGAACGENEEKDGERSGDGIHMAL